MRKYVYWSASDPQKLNKVPCRIRVKQNHTDLPPQEFSCIHHNNLEILIMGEISLQ